MLAAVLKDEYISCLSQIAYEDISENKWHPTLTLLRLDVVLLTSPLTENNLSHSPGQAYLSTYSILLLLALRFVCLVPFCWW